MPASADAIRTLCAAGAALMLAGAAPAPAIDPGPAGVPDGFTIAVGGDMIGPDRALAGVSHPEFEPVARLFRGADLGFANQEGSILDPTRFGGFPAAENGGGFPAYPPAHARDLADMGVRIVSLANNHATDWGPEGVLATIAALDAAGVAHAGAGPGEAAARAPGYVRIGKGMAAVVSTASTFPPMAVAGEPLVRPGFTTRPRPGISALHVRQVRLMRAADLARLRAIAGPAASGPADRPDEVRIADQLFRAAARPGVQWEMKPSDQAAVLASVRAARAAGSRFVLFTIHAHETAGNADDLPPVDYEPLVLHRANEAPSPDDPRPAGFEPALFHAAIDAGADAVVRTGPHVLGGIELYRGRPIFYSLGFLIFDFNHGARSYRAPNAQTKQLPDAWYETIIPVCTYVHGRIAEIRLHPALIESRAGPSGGLPRLAQGSDARRILAHVRDLSARYGTRVTIDGDVGVIRATLADEGAS